MCHHYNILDEYLSQVIHDTLDLTIEVPLGPSLLATALSPSLWSKFLCIVILCAKAGDMFKLVHLRTPLGVLTSCSYLIW